MAFDFNNIKDNSLEKFDVENIINLIKWPFFNTFMNAFPDVSILPPNKIFCQNKYTVISFIYEWIKDYDPEIFKHLIVCRNYQLNLAFTHKTIITEYMFKIFYYLVDNEIFTKQTRFVFNEKIFLMQNIFMN